MSQSRVKEREAVFQLLFSAEFSPELSAEELLALRRESEEGEEESLYIQETLSGALAYAETALALAAEQSHGWTAQRMSPTLRALLKLSIYEMLQSTEIPVKIAINEAVELAKHYEDEQCAKFLNGILGSIARKETPTEKTEQ